MSTTVTLKGTPFRVDGDLPAAGAKAPDFKLTSGALADVSLKDFAGKRKVLNIVPSLDTPTCAISTRKFHEQVGRGPGIGRGQGHSAIGIEGGRWFSARADLQRRHGFARGGIHPGRPGIHYNLVGGRSPADRFRDRRCVAGVARIGGLDGHFGCFGHGGRFGE